MSVEVAELITASEKKKLVILHLVQEDNSLKEVEGKIEAASSAGVAFKEKGSSDLTLLTVAQIEELAYAPEKPKPVSQKKLKPIEAGSFRQHLADRHGISRKWCTEASDEQAKEYHDQIDHSDLGHKHAADEAGDEAAFTQNVPEDF